MTCNDELVEEYDYNDDGQRIKQYAPHEPPSVYLRYNPKGQLTNLRDTEWQYDQNGFTVKKLDSALYGMGGSQTHYYYGSDTRLYKVILSNGDEITYIYPSGKGPEAQNPIKKYRNGRLLAQYEWLDSARLKAYKDYEQKMLFIFAYDRNRHLSVLRIMQFDSKQYMDFLSACDQVGTPKLFTLSNEKLLKMLKYDSFGNILSDSKPQLHIPVGFAGGLADRDTGLIRFGYRDYDPKIGRFLCPDPYQDRRGDGDLYDYCVDDPVSASDSNGLSAVPLLRIIWNTVKNPKIANGGEIKGDVDKLEDKARNGTITEEEHRRLKQQRHFLKKWEKQEEKRRKEREQEEFERQQIAPQDPHYSRR